MADMTARLARPGFALLFTLSMAQFMVVLDFTIVNIALPSIQHGLHVATTTLQWLVSAYAVAFGGFLLLGGRLADAYGRARMYRIGLVTFVVASAAGGLAVEPGLLIASRVIQGIGAALLAPAGLSLLVTSYPDEQDRSCITCSATTPAGFPDACRSAEARRDAGHCGGGGGGGGDHPPGTPERAGVTLSGCDAVCTLPNSGFCRWRTHCSAFSNA
jgi:Major Facilitator Superfamily